MSGGVIGPVVAGVLLERELAVAYIGAMLGSLALVAWLLLRLERIISPEVNGLSAPRAPTVPDLPDHPWAADQFLY